MKLEHKLLETDILIIGGGTAGCYSAITIAENSEAKVIIAEKANIKRSGCLAAGVNAINAYINEGETPESYVEYVKKDSDDLIREDLTYSIAKGLNRVTKKLEELGLPILKDSTGKYISRGKRSIKINGENIKPILAAAVREKKNITVLNKVNIIDYILIGERVAGAVGFSTEENILYFIYSKAVICAAGGASGLYKPNNPGFSKHKMWYPPFNTAAGYAIGIRAGAEMTSFEMRFIALRCKDTIAPTGTIAQGIGAEQVNAAGEEYVKKYGKPTTTMRLYATVQENRKGNGPCYLKTTGISEEQEEDLYKAYLNMAPAQTIKWIETGKRPSIENVEIEGTEPYITGGHTGSGYWIDDKRATTLEGLYAAGDAAGGSPKKYVTGCFVEGEIAALSALEYAAHKDFLKIDPQDESRKLNEVSKFLAEGGSNFTADQIEEAMQKTMDEYAGGISADYIYSEKKLEIAEERIKELQRIAYDLRAKDMQELLNIYELIDRLIVSRAVIKHLSSRKETRWLCYQSNSAYTDRDDKNWLKFVNTKYTDGEFNVIFRKLIKRDEAYEHKD